MHVLSKTLRKVTASIAIALIFFQPLLAEVVVDTSASSNNQATLSTASNGAPIVNIADPNANGLSHNKFESYSVDQNHLILNNATESVETLISGQIGANTNLTNGSARLILNEVTGSGNTMLEGYTEIAGQSAELIIANPNGITCRGCGFINTPQTSLVTGVPNIVSGDVDSFSIYGGHISVEQEALNVGNLHQINLISESVGISADIFAQELNVITGLNDVTADTLVVTVREQSGGGNSTLAIDSSQLGGMYANRINLVATESGVGVKLDGAMATDTSSVRITADGKIEISQVSSGSAVDISSNSNDVVLSDLVYAESVTLSAGQTLENSGVIASENTISINANRIENQQTIAAGIHADNSLNAGQNLIINTAGLVNTGQIFSTDSIAVVSNTIANDDGTLTALQGDIDLAVQASISNTNGLFEAGRDIVIDLAATFETQENATYNAGNLVSITADGFVSQFDTQFNSALFIDLQNDFLNSATLETSGDAVVQATNFENQGDAQFSSLGSIQLISTGEVFNAGVLTSESDLQMTAGSFHNRGAVVSGASLSFDLQDEFKNSNADDQGIPVQLNSFLSETTLPESYGGESGTVIFSVGDLEIIADTLLNEYADLYSLGDISISGTNQNNESLSFTNNSGSVNATGNIAITATSILNGRASNSDVDFAALCASSPSSLCDLTIVGGESEGVTSGTAITEAWLFDRLLALETDSSLTEAERYELARQVLFEIYLAAAYGSSISAGENITLTGSEVTNIGGDIQAGQDIAVNAEDFTNQTLVAVTPGPALIESHMGFLGGTVGSDVTYFNSDGTPETQLEYGLPINSIFRTHKLPSEPFLLVNANSWGADTWEDNGLPMMITESGELSAFASKESEYKLYVDENNELFLASFDEEDGFRVYESYSRWSLTDLTDEYIELDATTGQYQLKLGESTYSLITDENGMLSVDFDESEPMIEFEIQRVLSEYKTTALTSINYNPFDQPVQTEAVATTFFGGQLQAGGDIVINATNSFTNGLSTDGVQINVSTPMVELPAVEIDASTIGDPSLTNSNPDYTDQFAALGDAVPDASAFSRVEVDNSVPVGGGLFTESDSDEFLVATNESVSQFINSFGSDYLLEKLDYQPEQDVKRLGDGFYETYLVREAILSQTGSRFVNSALRSDQAQMRFLMDNAIAAQESMQLTIGVRLTAEQVAALTHDMLWLEEKLINGQRVLVPTLYLAQVRESDINSTGNVLARSISINTGNFQNSGGFVSRSFIDVAASNQLNNQGSMIAGSDIQLSSNGDLNNSGRLLAEGDVSLTAERSVNTAKGSVITGRSADISAKVNANLTGTNLYVSGALSVLAGQNIDLSAVNISTGDSIDLVAGRDIVSANNGFVETSRLDSAGSIAVSSGGSTELSRTFLRADDDISVESNGSLNLSGSSIDASSNATLTAVESIELNGTRVASVNETNIVSENDSLSLGSSSIAGNNVSLVAENNVALESTIIQSGSESNIASNTGNISMTRSELNTGGDLQIQAQNDVDLRSTSATVQGGMNILSASGDITLASSEIESTEQLNIIAKEGGISAANSNLSSSEGLVVDAVNDVAINSSSLNGSDVRVVSQQGDVSIQSSSIEAAENLAVQSIEGDLTSSQSSFAAGTDVLLEAGNDLTQSGVQITAGNTAALIAGGELSNTQSDQSLNAGISAHNLAMQSGGDINNDVTLEMDGSISLTAQNITNTARIAAGEGLSLSAQEDITNIAGELVAGNNLSLNAGNNIRIDALATETRTETDNGFTTSKEYAGSLVSAGNDLALNAGNDLTIMSSEIAAGNNVTLLAEGVTEIGAYQNEYYSYYEEKRKKKLFGITTSVTTKIKESFNTENVGSTISAGGNLTVNSAVGADGEINQAENYGKVVIAGSELSAGKQMVVAADGLTVMNQKEVDYSKESKEKSGTFLGLGNNHSSSSTYQELIAASRLESEEDMDLLSTGDITILGSDVSSGGTLTLDAENNINVVAAQTIETIEESFSDSSLNWNWDEIYKTETTRSSQTTTTTQAANLNAANNLNLSGSNIAVVGSNANAGNNLTATAENGDIQILSMEESQTSSEYSETFTLGMSDFGTLLEFDELFSRLKEDQQLSLSLAQGEFQSEDIQTQATTVQSSALSAGNSVTLDAANDIEIAGSDITADADNDYSGDISLIAGGDVTITESYETETTDVTQMEGFAELSLTVQNQVVEAYKAIEAVGEAHRQVKEIEKAYDEYKEDLKNLESRLIVLESDYAAGLPGIAFEHIEELSALIDNLKSDDKVYLRAIELAHVNHASKVTLALQATATASASVGTSAGFTAGLQLNVSGTETSTSTSSSTAVASSLSGFNVTIQSGAGAEGTNSQVNVSGSNVMATNTVDITTDELTVTSAQNTYQQTTQSNQTSASGSLSDIANPGGVSGNLNGSNSNSENSATQHANSVIVGNSVTVNTTGDATFAGANVVSNNLTLDVGGNLAVESQQNTYTSTSNSENAGVGTNFSAGGLNANGGVSESAQNTTETVLTSLAGASIDIDVAGNTRLAGSTIAATDADGNDTGDLSLTTGSLSVTHLSNNQTASSSNIGANSSLANDGSVGTTGIQFGMENSADASVTLATLGSGELTVTSETENDEMLLNRDSSVNSVDLYSSENGVSVDATLDTRIITEEGRKAIVEDAHRVKLSGNAIVDVVTQEEVKIIDLIDHIDNLQNDFDVHKLMAQQTGGLAAQILNDPNATPEEKQYALEAYVSAYADVHGINIGEASVIVANEMLGGAHIGDTESSSIYVNDEGQDNGLDYANTIGHEVTHALIDQGETRDRENRDDNEAYADLLGSYSEENYNFNFSNNELGQINTGDTNNHVDNESSELIVGNTEDFWVAALEDPENVDLEFRASDVVLDDGFSETDKQDESYHGSDKVEQPQTVGEGLAESQYSGQTKFDIWYLSCLDQGGADCSSFEYSRETLAMAAANGWNLYVTEENELVNENGDVVTPGQLQLAAMHEAGNTIYGYFNEAGEWIVPQTKADVLLTVIPAGAVIKIGGKWVRYLDNGNIEEIVDPETIKKVNGNPTNEMRHRFSENGILDPLTNLYRPVAISERISVDHIYPKARIKLLDGFDELTPEQQKKLLNDDFNLGNLQPLTTSLNSSKGSKLDWTTYRGEDLDPEYAEELQRIQLELEGLIQNQIYDLLSEG